MYPCVSCIPILLVAPEKYRGTGLSKRKRYVERKKKQWRNDGRRRENREGGPQKMKE